ncbi:ATP-dependent RNA helicase DDX19A, partial [Eleginops maclovinus]
MSGDSWAVSADVQEDSTAPQQLDFQKKVDSFLPAGSKVTDINGNIEPETDESLWGGPPGDHRVGPPMNHAGGPPLDLAEQSLLNKLIRRSLVRNRNQVEVLQRDPSSPLFSVKTFEELRLKPELLRGVYFLGFNRPSRIQENALPMMLAQPPQNLIAQSQSGTGKTAAFSLAMLSHVTPENQWTQ